MMLRDEDYKRIEKLKRRTGAQTKVEVLRQALDLLEHDVDREDKVARWRKAARLAVKSSEEVLADFQPHTLLKAAED